MKAVFTLSFLFLFTGLLVQTNKEEIAALKAQFTKADLPLEVNCKDVISEISPDFEFISYLEDYSFYADSNNLLQKENFEYLFHSVDSLSEHNVWSLKTFTQKTKTEFYNWYQIYPDYYFELNANVWAFIISIVYV